MASTSLRGVLCAGIVPRITTIFEFGSLVSLKSDFTSAADVTTSFCTMKSGVGGATTACTAAPTDSPAVSVIATVLSSTTIAETAAPYSQTISSISQPLGYASRGK